MEDFYQTPFSKFERYCPCGTPEEIAGSLRPYLAAGCRSYNLIPLADSQEQAIEGVAAVRAAVRRTAGRWQAEDAGDAITKSRRAVRGR